MTSSGNMTSSRPYMLRAIHEWVVDNDCTPYLLVDATQAGVQVPSEAVKDGKVVLNLAPQAVSHMHIGNDVITFLTRFSGISQQVRVPVAAVKALYAQETGQGLAFPETDEAGADPLQSAPQSPGPPASSGDGNDDQPPPPAGGGKPSRSGPHLRVIK